MKAGDNITSTQDARAEAGALGPHQFLDDYALAYHLAVAERLRERPVAVIGHARR